MNLNYKDILEKYKLKHLRHADLRGEDLREVNFSGVDLYYINLFEANLRGANLNLSNLVGSNLQRADLRGADLRGATIDQACLIKADLRGAYLQRADLSQSSLYGADLRGADLRGAILYKTNLFGAKYNKTTIFPSQTMILLSDLNNISDELKLELMRYDCENLENGKELFDKWALTNECPFRNSQFERAANFIENKKLWSYGPSKSAKELCDMYMNECMIFVEDEVAGDK